MKGANHSFLKQLTADEHLSTREWLEKSTQAVHPELQAWWTDQLMSLDNRRFFQAFSEILTVHQLTKLGWTIRKMQWPGPVLRVLTPNQVEADLLVLAFVRPLRPGPDRATRDTLIRALNRVESKSRICVWVRRWLPHDFDPDPIRRSIELWLKEVNRGTWESRYASYEDDFISLEFALTGEPCAQEQVPVAFTLGPLEGQRLVEALETRLVYHLDRLRMSSNTDSRPLLVSCVTDQPWNVSQGYLRDLLMGKPSQLSVLENGMMEQYFSEQVTASVFRDPLYRHVVAVWLAERVTQDPLRIQHQSFMNPWSKFDLAPDSLPSPRLSVIRRESEQVIMSWTKPSSGVGH